MYAGDVSIAKRKVTEITNSSAAIGAMNDRPYSL
jgi:hypothetical protein